MSPAPSSLKPVPVLQLAIHAMCPQGYLKISGAARCASHLEKQISSKLLTKKALHSPCFCWMQLKHLEETVLGRLVGCRLFAVSREGLMTFTPVSPWHQRAAPGVHVVLHLSPARSHALPEL